MPHLDRLRSAAAGILAAVTGMAAGHLAGALTNPAASPVLAVGTAVINATPTPVKEFAVREFGTKDKPLLIGSVLLATVLLAGACGILARRRRALGVAGLLLLVGLATAAALIQPAATALDVLPGAVTAAVGVGVLLLLLGGTRPAAGGRRGFLLAGLAAGAFAIAGESLIRAGRRIGDIVLPRAVDAPAPLPAGLEATYDGISSLVTPNQDFYRVDTNLTVPSVDVDDWTLVIDGDVEEELRLTFDELLEMDLVERDITLTCVSNEVGGTYVGAARWLGVPLQTLLDRARVGDRADQILSTAVDGFTISTPLDVATDGRDTLIAVGMNGKPLPREHGFPCRLVTPGIYGFVGATKWLTRLTLTTYDEDEAYWTERKWATDAPIKLSSRVDTPQSLSTIDPGRTVIGGVAWAQPVGVAKVEVRIDGGRWQEARLGPDAGSDYWRQWYLPWKAETGQHQIAVRATDRNGLLQTTERATPFPAGSSGVQETVVTVA